MCFPDFDPCSTEPLASALGEEHTCINTRATSPQPTTGHAHRGFYQVQLDLGFGCYRRKDTFNTKDQYLTDWGHWINRDRLHEQLNWDIDDTEGSPFVTAFDKYEEALQRVERLYELGYTEITIVYIDTRSLELEHLRIKVSDAMTINLPAWRDRNTGAIFFSARDVREHFRVTVPDSQNSEWYALDEIPEEMIFAVERIIDGRLALYIEMEYHDAGPV